MGVIKSLAVDGLHIAYICWLFVWSVVQAIGARIKAWWEWINEPAGILPDPSDDSNDDDWPTAA